MKKLKNTLPNITLLTALYLSAVACSVPESTTGDDGPADGSNAYIVITQTGGQTTVTEGGEADSLSIHLSERPEIPVSVSLTDSNGQLKLSPSIVQFTADDYQKKQAVSITAIDDEMAESNHQAEIEVTFVSGDSNYRTLIMPAISVAVTDNDSAGISISESASETVVSENGDYDSYTVALTTMPLASVTVIVDNGGSSQFEVSESELTFTPTNWKTGQVVTVSAVDDNVLEGSLIYPIKHTVTSADSAYNGLGMNDVNVTVHDNDNRLYVKKNAGGAQTGKSWQNAFSELRDALAVAVAGQEIWVAAGTYTPSDTADRAASFALKSNVALYGGLIGSESMLSERDTVNNETILSGDLNGDDFGSFTNNSENSYNVIQGDLKTGVVIDGFTVERGNADGSTGLYEHRGAGILLMNTSAVLRNLIIRFNRSDNAGGGLYMDYGAGNSLENIVFSTNSIDADFGAGAQIDHSAGLSMQSISFEYNTAVSASAGGLMLFRSNNATLSDIKFIENSGEHQGGAYLHTSSGLTLSELVFTSNTAATGSAGAMRMYACGNTVLRDSEFTSNSSQIQAGALQLDYIDNVTMSNVDFTSNSAVEYGGAVYLSLATNVTLVDTACTSNEVTSFSGGCLAARNSSTDLQISHGTFNQNSAEHNGGAIHIEASSGVVNNSLFTDNEAHGPAYGQGGSDIALFSSAFVFLTANIHTNTNSFSTFVAGSILVRDSDTTTIALNTFDGFTATDGGGAILIDSSDNTELLHNRFTMNTAGRGGALMVDNDSNGTVVAANEFISNTAVGSQGGGAFYVHKASTINNNLFKSNNALNDGGALYFRDSTAGNSTFTANRLIQNRSDREGGAIFALSALNLQFSKNLYDRNAASSRGGAIHAKYAQIYIENSVFRKNFCDGGTGGTGLSRGGALSGISEDDTGGLYTTLFHVKNSTFTDNDVYGGTLNQGGAIFTQDAGSNDEMKLAIYNSIFHNNRTGGAAHEISAYNQNGSSYFNMYTNIVDGGLAVIAVNDSVASLNDTLDVDPLFVAPSTLDLRLCRTGITGCSADSPALDAGLDANAPAGYDIDGNPRLYDITGIGAAETVDLGAYESTLPAYRLGNAEITLEEINPVAQWFSLFSPITSAFFTHNELTEVNLQTSNYALTAADNCRFEPTQQGRLVLSDGSTQALIPVRVDDNNSPHDRCTAIVQPNGNTAVTEGSTTDTLQVFITAAPTAASPAAEVTVTLTHDNQLQLSTTELVFTPENYYTPQEVFIQAVDDGLTEDSLHYSTISISTASSDALYDSLPAGGVSVTITDND